MLPEELNRKLLKHLEYLPDFLKQPDKIFYFFTQNVNTMAETKKKTAPKVTVEQMAALLTQMAGGELTAEENPADQKEITTTTVESEETQTIIIPVCKSNLDWPQITNPLGPPEKSRDLVLVFLPIRPKVICFCG